jgi:hypothetical protein
MHHAHRHYVAAAAVIALFFIAVLGAGCPLDKFKTASAPPVDVTTLKQPSPAAQPTHAPEIPAEAKNVPRPY